MEYFKKQTWSYHPKSSIKFTINWECLREASKILIERRKEAFINSKKTLGWIRIFRKSGFVDGHEWIGSRTHKAVIKGMTFTIP